MSIADDALHTPPPLHPAQNPETRANPARFAATCLKVRRGGGIASVATEIAVAANVDGRWEIICPGSGPAEAESFPMNGQHAVERARGPEGAGGHHGQEATRSAGLLDLPPVPRRCATNPTERLDREVRRRADVVGIFPNAASIIRLPGAVPFERNDGWQTASRCIHVEAVARIENENTDPIFGKTTQAPGSFPQAIGRIAPP